MVDSETLNTLSILLLNETQIHPHEITHTHGRTLSKQIIGTYFNQTQLERQLFHILSYPMTHQVLFIHTKERISPSVFSPKKTHSRHPIFPADHLLIQYWVMSHTHTPKYSRGREGSWELMDESSNKINLKEHCCVWSTRSHERTHTAVFVAALQQED